MVNGKRKMNKNIPICHLPFAISHAVRRMLAVIPFLINSAIMGKGRVDLIGAGPGDPGLLTLKGRDILAGADVIVYDALVNPQLLRWARPGAAKIFVGKRGGQHAKEQKEINEL